MQKAVKGGWALKRSEKVLDFVFTLRRQGFHFHIAPFRNRFQIVLVKVMEFSRNFDPVPCERKGVLTIFSAVLNSLRTRVYCRGYTP